MVRAPWLFVALGLPWLSSTVVGSNDGGAGQINGSFHGSAPGPDAAMAAVVNSTADPNGDRVDVTYPSVWIANLFYESLRDFTISRDVGNSACRRQTEMYVQHLKNNSHWAVQMSDSWSRYPTGILVSTLYLMGVYEECVEVHQPVQGKYCLPSIKIQTATDKDFSVGKHDEPEIYDPAWREIIGFVDTDLKNYINILNFGVCIPDSCTAQDLQISLQKVFNKSFLPHQVKVEVKVDQILCSTNKDLYPFDTGFYFTSLFYGLILIVCCLSTLYHLTVMERHKNGEKPSKLPIIINSFSIIQNGKSLINFDKNNDLNIFNGIKVVIMLFVLFGHKFMYTMISPVMYGKRFSMIFQFGPDLLLTSMNMVDPFFFIAGYLMYALLIPQFSKPGTSWYHVPMIIIYKYLRTLPPYLMMMGLTAFVIPHLGNGPLWAYKMWPEAEKCKTYWWANILAVSNFIEVDNQCLIVGWYISCLLQFTVIGTIIVYIYVKHQKLGCYIMVILLVFSMSASFISTYVYQAYGMVRVTYSFLINPANSLEYSNLYRPFYLRGTPFYAGLLSGVVIKEMKKREIKFSLPAVYVGTGVIFAICMVVQLYGRVFYELHRPYNLLEQSIYSVLSHCTWTIIFFCGTVYYFTSGYGILEKLFKNRLLVPLGRLSYSVYLVNITVILMIQSRQRSPLSSTIEFVIDEWIFSTFRIYLASILLYFTIEAPFGVIIKSLVYGNKKDNSNIDQDPKLENTTNIKNGIRAEQSYSTRL